MSVDRTKDTASKKAITENKVVEAKPDSTRRDIRGKSGFARLQLKKANRTLRPKQRRYGGGGGEGQKSSI